MLRKRSLRAVNEHSEAFFDKASLSLGTFRTKPKVSIYAFFLIYFFSPIAHANEDCISPKESQKILECSKAAFEISEKKLNSTYDSLLKTIKAIYSSNSSSAKDLESRIRSSQRLWVKLRSSNCVIETFQIESGTAAFETNQNYCLSIEADKRSAYLEYLSTQL